MLAPHHPEKAEAELQSASHAAWLPKSAPRSLPGRALFALGGWLMRTGRSLQQNACREPDRASPPTYTITL